MLVARFYEVDETKKKQEDRERLVGEVELEDKTFSSGAQGFYAREYIKLDGSTCYVQVILSRR